MYPATWSELVCPMFYALVPPLCNCSCTEGSLLREVYLNKHTATVTVDMTTEGS
jgi:hypothetical protein